MAARSRSWREPGALEGGVAGDLRLRSDGLRARRDGEVRRGHERPFRGDQAPLDGVLQLPNVPGPRVPPQELAGALLQTPLGRAPVSHTSGVGNTGRL